MAAALAGFNNYLRNTLHINNANVRNAINQQGLQSITDLIHLTDDDISEVCSNARKPGGTIANPVFDPANPIARVPTTIPNPGVLIGHIFERHLKILRYYVYHFNKRIQRAFYAPAATLARLNTLYAFKQQEEEHDNEVPLPDKFTNVDNIRVCLENLENYLQRKRGISGVLLAAYTREDVNLPPDGEDPGFGTPSILKEVI